MMMRMLEAGGIEILTDNIRKSDQNNTGGYYEFEPVKGLAEDPSFLETGDGRAVKIISWLLKHLPETYLYKVIFMSRNLEEIIDSQEAMLARDGRPSNTYGPSKLLRVYSRHLNDVGIWMSSKKNIHLLYANYNRILENPLKHVTEIADFLENRLDTVKMTSIVDSSQYRQKSSNF
jgi:hypothetical protein